GAAVLVEASALSVWRACQVRGVRAASARDVEDVDRAIRTLGPNYLVVEPAGLPIPLLKNLVETFRKGGAPCPPDSLGEGGCDGESNHEDRRGGRSGYPLPGPREPEERPPARHPPADLRRLDGGLLRSW